MDNTIEFGNEFLHWDDFAWSGPVKPPFFSSPDEAELFVNTKDEQQMPPSDQQLIAWQSLLLNKDTAQQAILQAAFDYYKTLRPKYAKAGPEWVANMPDLDRPDQLQGRIELNTVTLVWPYDEQSVRVGLLFRCAWDQEHGMGIVLDKTTVVDIGAADCAIV